MKEYLLSLKKYFWYALFFSFFINILYLTFPIYMLSIYDRVLASFSKPTLYTVTAGAIFAYFIYGILNFLRSRLLVYVSIQMDRDLRDDIFHESVLNSSTLNGLKYSQGISDLNIIRQFMTGGAIFSFFDLPWTPIYLLIIYIMHPVLGIVATAGGIVIFILGYLQEKLSKPTIQVANIENNMATSLMYTAFRNAEVVNSMGMTKAILARWTAIHDNVILLQTIASKYAGLLQTLTKVIRQLMQVFIYGIGAYLTLEHKSTAGIMIAASIIMGKALMPVEQMTGTWKLTVDARQAYDRLSKFIQEIGQRIKPMDLPPPKGKIEVENICLTVNDRDLLSKISFSLDPGETLAMIGPSGAGKTTLCRVILGLWEPTEGTVRIDGADITLLEKDKIGKHLGYLPQDIELFPGTIAENIARLNIVDSAKVIEAAKIAGIHELILKFPNGYDTPISMPGGVILSGGQRQRIGLARAFYGDVKLVILDEPNSNLDEEGEKALLRAISFMKKRGVTIILVTHKPGILGVADRIMVLKNGNLIMLGPKEKVFKLLSSKVSPSGPASTAIPRPVI